MDINEAYSLLRSKEKNVKVDKVYRVIFAGSEVYMFLLKTSLLDVSTAVIIDSSDKTVSFIEGPAIGVFMSSLKEIHK